MNAKSMFEELGYFYYKDKNFISILKLRKNINNEICNKEILRFKQEKDKWYLEPSIYLEIKTTIECGLFAAILKQIEELEDLNHK